ncbi:MAG TPA: hypothetical protein VKB41_00130 [Steroidobacteraceae bacterium]|jgi:hypothetical protein|nr:hypothetical protein [Steroidobacteraceae bacterium]
MKTSRNQWLLRSALTVLALVPVISVADLVQGVVSPKDAVVQIKDSAGNVVATLKGGPFQLNLAAGKFTAECTAPKASTRSLYSMAQPTTVNIDCK